MTRHLRAALAATLSIVLLGGGAATLATSSDDLAANPWTLVSLDGETVPADAGVTAVFGSDGKLSGSGGCNSYTSTYQAAADGTLVVQPVAATRKSCGGDIDGIESSYFTLLEASRAFAFGGGQLTITAAGGSLVFSAPGGIVGAWTLSSVNGTPVPASVTATAVFADGGALTGSGGCNTFNANYTVDGGDIAMGPIGSTRKACGADVMGVENSYLDALQSVTTFRVAGGVLTLTDTAATVTLTFTGGGTGPTDHTLTGTEWRLTSLGGTLVPAGSVLKVAFGEDFRVTGSGGCNTFSGDYTVDGGTLAIGLLASTRNTCAADIMARETSYLGDLESAASWSIAGSELIIVTGDGTKLVFAANGAVAPSPTPATGGIVGPTWKLSMFAGTAIGAFFTVTLAFRTDGTLSGNGGCNDYTADYTLAGEKLTITNAILGTETCPDKPGADSMEQGIVTVLPYLDTATLAGGQLTLGSSIAGVELVFDTAP